MKRILVQDGDFFREIKTELGGARGEKEDRAAG